MAHTWSPKKFLRRRQLRVTIAAIAVIACFAAFFFVAARKTIALTVDGKTREVQTYALSVDQLLREQDVHVQTHDQVVSASQGWLMDNDTVTVRKAYQVTLNINGKLIPYWTVAKSANELLGFFNQSVDDAATTSVDITNIYNELTGGFVIDQTGPVLVIWDGKQSIAPDGRNTAASILDSKAITLGKNDRVQIEKTNQTVDGVNVSTILRIQRVTTKNTTRNVTVPFTTTQVDDPNLETGTSKITQKGVNGVKTERLLVTLVDGVAESEAVVSSQVTQLPVEEIVSVGTKKVEKTPTTPPANPPAKNPDQKPTDEKPTQPSNPDPDPTPTKPNTPAPQDPPNPPDPPDEPDPVTPPPAKPTPPPADDHILHLTPAEAQSLAKGMMMDFYGWGNDQYSCLVTMWNRESGWRWNADNPYSDAYGIPQALPGSKMGTGWHDDASVQISWGLTYIANRYSNPCNAWRIWQIQGWY